MIFAPEPVKPIVVVQLVLPVKGLQLGPSAIFVTDFERESIRLEFDMALNGIEDWQAGAKPGRHRYEENERQGARIAQIRKSKTRFIAAKHAPANTIDQPKAD